MTQDPVVTLTEAQLKEIVSGAVTETLIKLGVDVSKPIDMQRDFQHLREWRMATQALQERGMLALLTLLVAGAAAAMWIGLKGMILQQH